MWLNACYFIKKKKKKRKKRDFLSSRKIFAHEDSMERASNRFPCFYIFWILNFFPRAFFHAPSCSIFFFHLSPSSNLLIKQPNRVLVAFDALRCYSLFINRLRTGPHRTSARFPLAIGISPVLCLPCRDVRKTERQNFEFAALSLSLSF